ncbi:MAG: ABC transporter substrate-binding protein [Chloroflexi bacterium]|nr:ABC transporter substrate-binding protein [Chloroflexota bacterium]
MKKSILFVVSMLLVASMVLSACAQPTEAPVITEPPVVEEPEVTEEPVVEEPAAGLTCAEPIKVGLITDITGALAIYGAMMTRSFMLGMEYATGSEGSAGPVYNFGDTQESTFKIDDCEIQVFVRDDAGLPENTTTVANELIDIQDVDFLVGTASSGATAVLQGIALANEVPLIVAPAAANDITGKDFNEYTFRTARNNYQDAMNECKALTQSYSTFIQIAADYAFGHGSAEAFRDACSLEGGTFVADDIFAPATTTDFTPYMEQIAASGAEAYIVTWAGSGFISLVQAAADQGVTDTMELGTTFIDNMLTPVFYGNAIGTTAGIVYHWSAPDNPANDFLVAESSGRYGIYPDLFDADGMNAAIMIIETLKKTNTDTTPSVLIAAMEGLEFEGPKGTIYIRPEDHVAIQDMYILKLENVTDATGNYYSYVDTTRPEPPCLLPEALQHRCGDLPIGSLTGK